MDGQWIVDGQRVDGEWTESGQRMDEQWMENGQRVDGECMENGYDEWSMDFTNFKISEQLITRLIAHTYTVNNR